MKTILIGKTKKYPRNLKFAACTILTVILLMQFTDSFITEFYDKFQSMFLTDFLIDGRGMEYNKAAAYLNMSMMPCYAITALAPAARLLIDKWGIKPVFLLNILVLMSGCTVCMLAPNILCFLVGNAIITFSCTMNIQYIYIVRNIPSRYRATVYGVTNGVTSIAAILIPAFRNLLINHYQQSWRSLYIVGIILTIFVLLFSILFLKNNKFQTDKWKAENNKTKNQKKEILILRKKKFQTVKSGVKSVIQFLRNNHVIRQYLILLLVLGTASAGITFYNEPIISFVIKEESAINRILLIQPIVTLLFNLLNGILADHISRKRIIIFNIIGATFSIALFVFSSYFHPIPIILGITWGIMIGTYFSAMDLMNLFIMELAPDGKIGTLSAIATYTYGTGDAVGMLMASLLAIPFQMGPAKILLTIPIFGVSLYLLLRKNNTYYHK